MERISLFNSETSIQLPSERKKFWKYKKNERNGKTNKSKHEYT